MGRMIAGGSRLLPEARKRSGRRALWVPKCGGIIMRAGYGGTITCTATLWRVPSVSRPRAGSSQAASPV